MPNSTASQVQEPMLPSECDNGRLPQQPPYEVQKNLFFKCGNDDPIPNREDIHAKFLSAKAAINTDGFGQFKYKARNEEHARKVRIMYLMWGLELKRSEYLTPVLNGRLFDVNFRDLRLAVGRHGWHYVGTSIGHCMFEFKPVTETASEARAHRIWQSLPVSPSHPLDLPRQTSFQTGHDPRRYVGIVLSKSQVLELEMPRTQGLTMPVEESQVWMDEDHADVPGIVSPRFQPPYELQRTLLFILDFGYPATEDLVAWMTAAKTLVGYKLFKYQGYVSRSMSRKDDRWGWIVEATREHQPPPTAGKDRNFRLLRENIFQVGGWFLAGQWGDSLLFMPAFPGEPPRIAEETRLLE